MSNICRLVRVEVLLISISFRFSFVLPPVTLWCVGEILNLVQVGGFGNHIASIDFEIRIGNLSIGRHRFCILVRMSSLRVDANKTFLVLAEINTRAQSREIAERNHLKMMRSVL